MFLIIGYGYMLYVAYSKIDLSSRLRHAFGYILFSRFKVPEWYLICWQIAFRSYMSSYMAFPQIWNCLVPPGKFQALVFNYFSSFVNFRENWLAHFGICSCVKPALFGLLCAWRRVRILRQQGWLASSLWWATGATRVVIVACVCVLALWISLCFAFFTKLGEFFPGCLGDP
jgi:hypothetical protein